MPQPQKRKVKVKVKQNARLKKKGESADSVKRMPAQLPRTVGPVFKVKVRKKK